MMLRNAKAGANMSGKCPPPAASTSDAWVRDRAGSAWSFVVLPKVTSAGVIGHGLLIDFGVLNAQP